jgi:predicted acylesterase/phospholipase RssA
MGYNAVEIERIAKSIDWNMLLPDNLSRRDLYVGQKRWAPFGNIVLELDDGWNPKLPSSLYRANNLNLQLFELFAPAARHRSFASLPIPFSCVATDLHNGDAKVFSKGSLMQAVRASLSVPSLMLPFNVNERVYIDGGIAQNLPISQVRDMGAETVIGLKVNSSLRDQENLDGIIEILDQTINIGITRNLNETLEDCDLLLEPDLFYYSSSDFKYAAEIISIGELYAREHIDKIREFARIYGANKTSRNLPNLRPEQDFFVTELSVEGNNRLSFAKIREYLGMEVPATYSAGEISIAARNALNSQLFNVLYPELLYMEDGSYKLIFHVQERQPKALALNNAYNDEDKLTASAILSIDNQVLKNSKLLAQIVLGGRNELNIDYVKNFGELWGIYYRIFPYLNEKTMYSYNEDHLQVKSTKSLEWGATSGIGVFTKHNIISEAFLYYSNTSLYRGISETEMPSRNYAVAGFGLKTYYESLDDYSFPKRGILSYVKLNFARDEELSDFVYSDLRVRADVHIPLSSTTSVDAGISGATYIDAQDSQQYAPYPIGGIDGFKGYSRYEISAPHYRVMQLGISGNYWQDIHLQFGIQGLSYNDNELLGDSLNDEYCYYASIGLYAFNFPIRLQFALNERKRINSMFSIGYDWDIFHFSRK